MPAAITKTCRSGRLVISFEGGNLISEEVLSELATALPGSADQPHLLFHFVPSLSPFEHSRVGSTLIGGGRIRVVFGRLTYEIDPSESPLRISVASNQPRFYHQSSIYQLQRLYDWNYMYPHQNIAKNFLYNVFDWTTQLAQLGVGQSYFHASAITKGRRAIAFLAWGGVGKTTALLKLCLEDEWKYLSDDLAVIDVDGIIYRSPKKLQIYGYNVHGQPHLAEQLLSKRAWLDLAAWWVRLHGHGPRRVRRRVAAEEIFGAHRVAAQAQVTDVVFLERASNSHCRMAEIDTVEIARRMAPIVMAEIEPYGALARQAEAGGSALLNSPAAVQEQTREVLSRAFDGARAMRIQVGIGTGPDELATFIRQQVIGWSC